MGVEEAEEGMPDVMRRDCGRRVAGQVVVAVLAESDEGVVPDFSKNMKRLTDPYMCCYN